MIDDHANGRTFRPVIRENRILAGGMLLFQVDDMGRVIFEDRHLRRCVARGTNNVSVDVLDLMEALLSHYRQRSW